MDHEMLLNLLISRSEAWTFAHHAEVFAKLPRLPGTSNKESWKLILPLALTVLPFTTF